MKILLATISLDPERGGGTAERTRRLARTLASMGHSCTVIALDGTTWQQEFERAGVVAVTTGAFGRRFRIPRLNPVSLWRRVRDQDAIHVLGYWNLLSAAICLAARLAGIPYVLSAAGEFAALDHPRALMRWFHVLLGRPMIRGAALLIAITELERTETIARLRIAASRIVVVPNGVDESPAEGDGRRLPAAPFILFVGRLAPIKGPDLLVEAFARIAAKFPDVMLVIAGPDGGMQAMLRQRCAALGAAQRVLLLGYIDEAERAAAYRRAILLAIPSRSEAMSLVALEAGAAGAPVLLTDRCGFDEVQAAGGGMVVSASAEAIAAGLAAMLQRRDELPAMGQRLRALVGARYGWRVMATRLVEHLAAACGMPT